jgi:hypothetical protein
MIQQTISDIGGDSNLDIVILAAIFYFYFYFYF